MKTKPVEKQKTLPEQTGIPSWRDAEITQQAFNLRVQFIEKEMALKAEIESLMAQIAEKRRTVDLNGWGGGDLETAIARDECTALDAKAADLRRQLLELRQAYKNAEIRIGLDLEPPMTSESQQLRGQYVSALQHALDMMWDVSKFMDRAAFLYSQAVEDFPIDADPSDPRYQQRAGIESLHWQELRSHTYRTEYTSTGPLKRRVDTRLEAWMRAMKERYPETRLPDDLED